MFNVLSSFLPRAEPELSFSFSIKAVRTITEHWTAVRWHWWQSQIHAQISNIATLAYITCQLQNKFWEDYKKDHWDEMVVNISVNLKWGLISGLQNVIWLFRGSLFHAIIPFEAKLFDFSRSFGKLMLTCLLRIFT